MPELIDAGSQALVHGDFPTAAQAFNAIRDNYGEEPIWLEGQLPAKILPLAGFASHKAQLQDEAIAALESYLADYAEPGDTDIFARYTLASSLLLDGQEAAARKAFSDLRAMAGDSSFRDLAALREAQLSETPRAIEILQQVVATPASPRLSSFARLRLAQLYLEQGNTEQARIQLLDTPWPRASMPELATLSLLASQLAEQLIADHPADALRAYRLVAPQEALVRAQEQRIDQLRKRYRQRAPTLQTEQSMWSDQFRQSIKRLQAQLQNLRDAPGYQQAVDLRKARCFARINRPLEACILLRPIAQGESELAREGHLEWISATRSMQAWNAASKVARDFLEKYPEDKDIPQILFWIALAQIEQEDFAEAIRSLQAVLERSPAKAITAAAHYYQGYCHFSLGNTPAAIPAFERCQSTDPQTPVAIQAHLWIGICQFTTNKLEQAIATFQSIQQNEAASFIHPEASFRETACHFALGSLEQALAQSESWQTSYPGHAREAEAFLLQGDILTELSQTGAAIQAYAKVQTNDRQLSFLALEKRSSLLIETQRKDEAREALESYRLQHPVLPAHIGSYTKTLAACLPRDQAQQEIAQAVAAYGNNPNSAGIEALILQLETPPAPSESQPTLASRLLVAAIQIHRQKGEDTQAKLKALQLASRYDIEALPPAALAEGGNALTEISSLDAPLYFKKILDQYPDSIYTDDAYLGLAKHHATRSDPAAALAHLLQATNRAPQTLSLKLELEIALEQTANAQRTAEQILSDRQASPTHKSQALQALGDIELQDGSPRKAYAYYQRIFTLYRGETDYVAHAYQSCIQILSAEERLADARQVATEFLAQSDLRKHPAYHEAQTWVGRAAVTQPEQAK